MSLDARTATLHQVVSEMNKRERQLFPNVAIAGRNHNDCVAGDKLQQDIRNWLSPPDPWKHHHVARESHHTGTAAWFIHGNTFSEWKSSPPSSLLWIHGKRGFTSGAYEFLEADSFLVLQRARERVYFGMLTSDISVLKAYDVDQFHNHRRD